MRPLGIVKEQISKGPFIIRNSHTEEVIVLPSNYSLGEFAQVLSNGGLDVKSVVIPDGVREIDLDMCMLCFKIGNETCLLKRKPFRCNCITINSNWVNS